MRSRVSRFRGRVGKDFPLARPRREAGRALFDIMGFIETGWNRIAGTLRRFVTAATAILAAVLLFTLAGLVESFHPARAEATS